VSSLRDSAIHGLVLVCCRASWSTGDQRLREWLESEEGKGFYQQTLASIRESRIPELKVLAVATWLWCSRFDSHTTSDSSPPGYLADFRGFDQLLRGSPVGNLQGVLETMALSIKRVFGKKCHPAILCHLQDAIVREPPVWSDKLSDLYWCYSLHGQLEHSVARDNTERRVLTGGINDALREFHLNLRYEEVLG
jgi:hypothetical protein